MRLYPLVFCTVALAAGQAHAGAWTEPKGQGEAIVTGSYYQTSTYYDNEGHKQSEPSYRKYDVNPYVEYGLTDDLTLGANLYLDDAHQDAAPGGRDHSNVNLGDSEFFLRARLWQQQGFVVSAEPLIKLPSPESSTARPRLGGTSTDAAMGLSAGYSFQAWGLTHYADLDTQYRYRFGSAHDQVNLAATLGIGLSPRWTIMPQAFMTWRVAAPANPAFTQSSGDDYNLTQLQLSALYKVRDDLGMQVGGFSDVYGRNTGTGEGVLMAVWKQF
ncbi:MAG: hypothetical protein KGJ06_00765 [Pseudomonadota bacterium]|nr:hypothetical protein [Pseudomonadota bacterium]